MTKAAAPSPSTLDVEARPDESKGASLARALLQPETGQSVSALAFACAMLDQGIDRPRPTDYVAALKAEGTRASSGDLAFTSRMLIAQASTLSAMFAEFSRRSALNMGEHLTATESYARLALKAQGNGRATLEALAKLHQPREQTVRHVHVNEGGQAIVTEQFHHHAGGANNAESDKRSHATATTPGPGVSPALPRSDEIGDALPIASRSRAQTMPPPRRA